MWGKGVHLKQQTTYEIKKNTPLQYVPLQPFGCGGLLRVVGGCFFMTDQSKDIALDRALLKKYKCSAKPKAANKRFTDAIDMFDVLGCLKRFNFRCAYCNVSLKADWQLDHFYPRAMGGKNRPDNLCPTCSWCNTMKNALDGWAFIHRCKKIMNNNQIVTIGAMPDGYKN